MRRSIRWKITSSYLVLVLLVLTIFTTVVVLALERQYMDTYKNVVSTQAKMIALMMRDYAGQRDFTDLEGLAQEFRWRPDARIVILDASGRSTRGVVVAPDLPEEVALAVGGREGQAVRFDATTGERRVFAATPILGAGDTLVGVVHVSVPGAWVWRQLRRMVPALGTALVIGMAAAWFVGSRLSRRITRPLEKFTQVAERVSAGDFAGRAPIDDTEELGRLGSTFNTMAAKLKQKIQEISEEQKKIEAIVSGMVDAVIATDRHGQLILLNRAAEELLRISRNHAQGRPAQEVLTDRRLIGMLEEATGRGRVTATELPAVSPDDRVIEAHCAPIKGDGGDVIGAVAVLRDVTVLRHAERLRRELTANVSHELRTPLTSIKGFAETLLHGAMKDEATCRRFLTIIDGEADRLVKLVDDLLDLSRLESKGVTLELGVVDLGQLVAHTIDKLRPLAEESKLVLAHSGPSGVLVVADSDRLEVVLTNLIDNALKYTPPGGRVDVEVLPTDHEVTVAVTDTGRGIPPDDLPHVFERFYRADRSRARRSGSGGTGLGLAIAKHIVEAHGGVIGVRSRLDEGTTFLFTLPRNGATRTS